MASHKLRAFRDDHQPKRLTMDEASKKVDAPHRALWFDWEKRDRIPSKLYMPKLIALVDDLDPGDFYKAAPEATDEELAA